MATKLRPNRSFDTDTQRHCAASRAREHTSRGAMPLRAGQLQRSAARERCKEDKCQN